MAHWISNGPKVREANQEKSQGKKCVGGGSELTAFSLPFISTALSKEVKKRQYGIRRKKEKALWSQESKKETLWGKKVKIKGILE